VLPLAHRRWWLTGAWLIAAAIVGGSLLPGPLVATVSAWDKLEHATAYGALTLWTAGMLERRRYGLAAILAFALGASLELVQGAMTSTRQADPLDLVANLTGIALALALAHLGLGGWAGRIELWLGAAPRR
jgi:VanZ family protein